ncbi:hypothetical protein CAJAP_08476 [Camponotus japonicus]
MVPEHGGAGERHSRPGATVLLQTKLAAFARLLTTIIAPLTTQLGEVTQPSAIRFRRRVTVPDFLFNALTRSRTRARHGYPDGSQTTAITPIQAPFVTLAITRRYTRLGTTASA